MYIGEYHLTFLRILVLWALAVIAILLVACIATIYKKNFPLFQYVMIVVTVCYIAFSFAKPDYIIAKYNLMTNRSADLHYLADLSSDAIPALEEGGVLDDIVELEGSYYKEKYEEMGILDFNISYYKAARVLKDY